MIKDEAYAKKSKVEEVNGKENAGNVIAVQVNYCVKVSIAHGFVVV